MKEKAVIRIPLNLTDGEICAALKTQGIQTEDIEISRKDVKVWYDYHPSAKDPSSDFEQALLSASAAKAAAAETERKTQDILVAELTAKITGLQENLEIVAKQLNQKAVETSGARAVIKAAWEMLKYGDKDGNYSIVNAIFKAELILRAALEPAGYCEYCHKPMKQSRLVPDTAGGESMVCEECSPNPDSDDIYKRIRNGPFDNPSNE